MSTWPKLGARSCRWVSSAAGSQHTIIYKSAINSTGRGRQINKEAYFGAVPRTYEPVSFGTPHKCRFWELIGGDHAAPDDTVVVGIAIEHVYRVEGASGKMKSTPKTLLSLPMARPALLTIE